MFLLLNLLSLSAVLPFSISPLFKHLCGARCTSAPWVFCTPVRRMLAPDLCFGPLKAGKVSWWTIFLVAMVMSEDLERCSGTGMQWQLLACEFSHWDMEMHWGSEQRRWWGETPTRTHIIIAHSALWLIILSLDLYMEVTRAPKGEKIMWGWVRDKGDLWVSVCVMMNVGETECVVTQRRSLAFRRICNRGLLLWNLTLGEYKPN